MHNYPSDISREQFEIIRPELEGAKRKTKPRKYDLYDIFCAILYILRGGVQWRMLPSNFPSWKLVEIERRSIGRNDKTGVCKKVCKKTFRDRIVIGGFVYGEKEKAAGNNNDRQ